MIGYRYSVSESISWRDNQGGIFPLSPAYLLADISEPDARRIMKDRRAFFLRWEGDFDSIGYGPWWHVIKDAPDAFEDLPKKTRYLIRQAAKGYDARPVSVEEVLKSGYQVYSRAYARYDTHERFLDYSMFSMAITSLPENTEFWAVYERDSEVMVAFSENYIEANVCFYVTMWFDPDALKKSAGYLLFHEMEVHYLVRRNFKYISDGARSLSHNTNIHDFLIKKFKFRKAYARLQVVYQPWLGVIVSATYPFRFWIAKIKIPIFKKALILLEQEGIRRQCLKDFN